MKLILIVIAIFAIHCFLEGGPIRAVALTILAILGVYLALSIGSTPSKPPIEINDPTPNNVSDTNDPPIIEAPEPEIYYPQSYYLVKELKPYHETNGMMSEASVEDVFGNRYSFALRGYMDPLDGDFYQLYDLGDGYDSLSFTVFAYCNSDAKEEYRGSIYIYGDNSLLYKNENITCLSYPEDITVSLKGYKTLKIEMYGEGNMGFYGVDSCMGDIIITKTG